MILIKKYKDRISEFETTLEKELVFLAKTFIDPDNMITLLKEGKTVTTPWATYRAKEVSNKQKIENEIVRVMGKSINKESNEDNYLYLRGFINGCIRKGLYKVLKIIKRELNTEFNIPIKT